MKKLLFGLILTAACTASPSNSSQTTARARTGYASSSAGRRASAAPESLPFSVGAMPRTASAAAVAGAAFTGSGSFADAFASVKDYGAAGDGVTDDTAAIQAAADAIGAGHGGTIFFPPGRYRVTGQITYVRDGEDDHDVHFVGVGGASAILLDAPASPAFYVGNVGLASFEKLTFLPYAYGATNAAYGIILTSVWRGVVRECDFIGLKTSQSVVYIDTAGVQVVNCGFRGSIAPNGVVYARRYRNVRVSDSQFVDYGVYAGQYYSLTGASSWIYIGDPSVGVPAADDALADFNVRIERTGFDEGAFSAIKVDSGNGLVQPKITIVDSNHLVGTSDSYLIRNVDRLEIVRCGWRARSGPHNVLTLSGVRQVVIDRGDVDADATASALLHADAGSEIIKISDMSGPPLVLSTAPTTRVIYDQSGMRSLAPFTSATRPSAAGLAPGSAIWNSDTGLPNYADGAGNWVEIKRGSSTENWTFSGNDVSLSAPGMMGFNSFTRYIGSPAAVPASPWIAPALVGGWVNLGAPYSPAGFFKDASGLVHLRGALRGGRSAALFQLPPGYRPATTLLLGAGYRSGGRGAGVQVDGSGNVAAYGDDSTTLESVDGISFLAEQ